MIWLLELIIVSLFRISWKSFCSIKESFLWIVGSEGSKVRKSAFGQLLYFWQAFIKRHAPKKYNFWANFSTSDVNVLRGRQAGSILKVSNLWLPSLFFDPFSPFSVLPSSQVLIFFFRIFYGLLLPQLLIVCSVFLLFLCICILLWDALYSLTRTYTVYQRSKQVSMWAILNMNQLERVWVWIIFFCFQSHLFQRSRQKLSLFHFLCLVLHFGLQNTSSSNEISREAAKLSFSSSDIFPSLFFFFFFFVLIALLEFAGWAHK